MIPGTSAVMREKAQLKITAAAKKVKENASSQEFLVFAGLELKPTQEVGDVTLTPSPTPEPRSSATSDYI